MTNQPLPEPWREEINQLTGAVIVEFGASWCSYCRMMQDTISTERAKYPNVSHLKIEDGKGRKLGRSFAVKLWPTLIFMKDGIELTRLVRQFSADEMRMALAFVSK